MLANTTVVIWVTITSALTGQSPVQTVPACPVQVRAHHHIDINDILIYIHVKFQYYYCMISRCIKYKPGTNRLPEPINGNDHDIVNCY